MISSSPLLSSFVSAFAVSLFSLAGLAALPLGVRGLNRANFVLVSLATGALFGDVAIHLLPEIFARSGGAASSLWILAGIFSSFVFEKLLRWKHRHGVPEHETIKPVGRIVLVSDSLHNFMDGALIAASYLSGPTIGLATTFAVILHELPHELGDFAILVDSGYSRGRALFYNFLSACAALVGVLAVFALGRRAELLTAAALPVTAGFFLYIAGANLTPELQKESEPVKSLVQSAAMALGMGLMLALVAAGS
ncbi:MAG: ZIP family metal transporter [Elusimicrobia bacterium]|nr:ZIP family metal transporter [Elusimicrobiota bacterium]